MQKCLVMFKKSMKYNEVFNIRQEVDNSTAFIPLLSASGTKGSATLEDCKSIIIKNDRYWC